MARILIIDDEASTRDLARTYLEREGFEVIEAVEGNAGLEAARQQSPDVVILDLMLPGLDGVELCRRLRGNSNVYIMMLTARSDELDRVVGLSVGADDYVTKPFSPRELVARVKAMLRRPHGGEAQANGPILLQFSTLSVDVPRREVKRHGKHIDLTRTEFDVLRTLAERPGMVFSRDRLIQCVWGDDFYGDERVVDAYIKHLRQKLEDDPSNPQIIHTIRGVGYTFEERLS